MSTDRTYIHDGVRRHPEDFPKNYFKIKLMCRDCDFSVVSYEKDAKTCYNAVCQIMKNIKDKKAKAKDKRKK